MRFAHLGGLGDGGCRGALWIALRKAPLREEGLHEGGGCLQAKAGVGSFGVVVRAPCGQRETGVLERGEQRRRFPRNTIRCRPRTPEQVARQFRRARAGSVQPLLESLTAEGQAQLVDSAWFAA